MTIPARSLAGTETFSYQLRQIREATGLSLGGLSLKSGVSKATLSRWEAGKVKPSIPELDTVLTALSLTALEKEQFFRLLPTRQALHYLHQQAAGLPLSGDLLRAMRLRKGWTQTQTAQAIGVTQANLSKWEHSIEWPDVASLHSLCFVLDALPEEVVTVTTGWLIPPQEDLAQIRNPIDLQEAVYEELNKMEVDLEEQKQTTPFQLLFYQWEAMLQNRPEENLKGLFWEILNRHTSLLLRAGFPHSAVIMQAERALRILTASSSGSKEGQKFALRSQIALSQIQRPLMKSYELTQEAVRLYSHSKDVEHPEYQIWLWMESASLLSQVGPFHTDMVMQLCKRASDIPTEFGDRMGTNEHRSYLGQIMTRLRQHEVALEHFDFIESNKPTPYMKWFMPLQRAIIFHQSGNVADARAIFAPTASSTYIDKSPRLRRKRQEVAQLLSEDLPAD